MRNSVRATVTAAALAALLATACGNDSQDDSPTAPAPINATQGAGGALSNQPAGPGIGTHPGTRGPTGAAAAADNGSTTGNTGTNGIGEVQHLTQVGGRLERDRDRTRGANIEIGSRAHLVEGRRQQPVAEQELLPPRELSPWSAPATAARPARQPTMTASPRRLWGNAHQTPKEVKN